MVDFVHLIKERLDGWFNVFTGMGNANTDKRVNTKFALSEILSDQDLIEIYRGDGLGRRVIDVPVGDSIRNWFYIENDTDNVIIRYLARLSAKKYVKSALRWSRLFGGSVLYMGVDDGQTAEKPVNETRIKGIRFFEVYDKRSISWMPDDLYSDERNPKFGQPEIYTITNPTTSMSFRVHESRCLVFNGVDTPEREKVSNGGWGDSILQAIFTRLRGVCDSLAGVEAINTEFIVGVLKISNLAQLLSNKDGETLLRERLKALDLSKHVLNSFVIDKNEEYERASSFGVSGLRDLVDVLIDVLCGISGIPRVKLVGDQAKGLGGEAAGNIRMYYDEIATHQEDDIEPQLNKLVSYCMKASEVEQKEFKNWRIVFNSLWKPTEKEEAETRLLNAKTDTLYIQSGLPAEYFFLSRFGGQSYGREISIPIEYVNKLNSMKVEELIKKAEERIKTASKPMGEDHNEGGTAKDNPGDKSGA